MILWNLLLSIILVRDHPWENNPTPQDPIPMKMACSIQQLWIGANAKLATVLVAPVNLNIAMHIRDC